MISKTKIYENFPVGKFSLPGFSVSYRFNHDSKGFYFSVQEDIQSDLLSIENKLKDGFYVDLNLDKNKWLVCKLLL